MENLKILTELRDMRGPCHRQALRRRVLRRLQRFLPPVDPEKAQLHLQVQPELRGGQGQEEPVQVLPAQKVLQGGHEEGCCAERARPDQRQETQPGRACLVRVHQ